MTFKISIIYTHNTSHNFGISGIEYRYPIISYMYIIGTYVVNNEVKHSIVTMMHEVFKFKMQ